MLPRRTISPTFLGAAIVAAALLTGTVRADSAAGADAAEEARAEQFVRRRIPGLTPRERDERASRAGELRIRGRTRLSGTVFATHVHVERDAEVETDGDLVIYSTGGIVIDAPIGGSATVARRKSMKVPPPGTGANGVDGADITMIDVAGDIAINSDLYGNAGQGGETVNIAGPFGRGGDGGRGGDVTVWAKKKGATVTVSARIICGRGGAGGRADVTGANGGAGLPGQNATAIGGDAGDCGDVNISATNVVFVGAGAFIEWSESSSGGAGNAIAGRGGDAVGCFGPQAGNGGNARAEGGDAGRGSTVVVTAKSLTPDASTPGGAAAFVKDPIAVGGGGVASATPGSGGFGDIACDQTCPAAGRTGSDGASSGASFARAGNGAAGSRILGSAFAGRTPSAVEQGAGGGGAAFLNPVGGRPGEPGEDALRPGTGGRGGDVGRMTALGGKGGACRVGVNANGSASGGGIGGSVYIGAQLPVVTSGSGGPGGNCCPNQNSYYLGGTGGTAGKVGPLVATPGKGGKCKTGGAGGDGDSFLFPPTVGAKGGKGADCPVVVGEVTMSDATLTDPLYVKMNAPLRLEFTNRGAQVTLLIEVCCDGRPIGHFQFAVGGGSPGLPFIAVFLANLYINEKHAGHRISIMLNGKTVKEFIRAVL